MKINAFTVTAPALLSFLAAASAAHAGVPANSIRNNFV